MKAVSCIILAFLLGASPLSVVAEPETTPSPRTDTAPEKSAGAPAASAEYDAEWIWSPSQTKNEIPVGDCYFRKTFEASDVEAAQIQLTADNGFELFVNGQSVAKGADWRQLQIHDITEQVRSGRNVIAIRVSNTDVGPAGLVARVLIKQKSGTFVGHSTDATWKTSVRRFQDWQQPVFSDSDWLAAVSYGPFGEALPWGNEMVVAGEGARFAIDSEFEVERIMRDAEVGSLIAMTFDARGNIIVSKEGGGLLLLSDTDKNGVHDHVTPYCDEINSAQGLLALGSRLFVVGSGPDGAALYRLRDKDHDGKADEVAKLIGYRGSRGEHGPHALRLGPDGLIYGLVGNFARADAAPTARDPYRQWYEGDLVQPRYEDAGGHEVSIPAPGGTIYRTDAEGKFVEYFAGGLRNPYDFAFSPTGELFTYDADMEWDRGAPWYRPTRVNHVPPGAEFGWRTGWAKWPDYYLDSVPATVNVGPGSPTGVEFYDHFAFPAKYHGAMFGCDWAAGKIYAFTFERQGAGYTGKKELFLKGQPLNATDCAVGPDGALYFTTGGRGTDGGVYRIRWTGRPDPKLANLGDGIDRALRQPQLDADWARAKIAAVKMTLGDQWETQLIAAARDSERPVAERVRAVDLMIAFGPRPTEALLQHLAKQPQTEVRVKAAQAMAFSDDATTRAALVKLLGDANALVRRTACESLSRRGTLPDAAAVLPLLDDQDRAVAYAAGRLLELLPVSSWADVVLKETNPHAFSYGAAALANVERKTAVSQAIVNQGQSLLGASKISDDDKLDLLRVLELAMIHGSLGPDSQPKLGKQLLDLYPSTDSRANRELVELLVHLQVPGAADKFAAELAKDQPMEEKLHVAAYAARLKTGWSRDAKLKLLQFYEQARTIQGGYSVDKYIENFSRDFLAGLTIEEKRQLLAAGDRWPATSLSILAKLPPNPGPAVLAEIRQLDRLVAPRCAESNAFRRLRVGIIAVLGAADDQASQEYLRSIYQNEPEYRDPVAMSLTQRPEGANWPYLVDALRSADQPAAQEIMSALAKIPQRPKEAAPYRHVILLGLRLGESGAREANALLAHWNGETPDSAARDKWKSQIAHWQSWYAEKFPTAPAAALPIDAGRDKWSYKELVAYLDGPSGHRGNASRGTQVFAAAQCASCHRSGNTGETIGPDLSTVSQRFQRKEILEAIVYPSHVVSDQYATRVVTTKDGKSFAGLVVPQGNEGVTILLSNGQKVELRREEIEETHASKESTMPTGLLNTLSLDQVADLFAYLTVTRQGPSTLATRPTEPKK